MPFICYGPIYFYLFYLFIYYLTWGDLSVKHCFTKVPRKPSGTNCCQIQKHRGKPLLFHDKCPGFFYVRYTTHRTYSFTSHLKDEAIMVKCLAQGHKRRDGLGRDSNSHSNIRTRVQCTRPLGHDTPPIDFTCVKKHKYLNFHPLFPLKMKINICPYSYLKCNDQKSFLNI